MIKKFSLPDYYFKGPLIVKILDYKMNHQDYFYNDRIVDSVYGANPTWIWTGGRDLSLNAIQEKPITSIIDEFNDYPKVKLRHVLSNLLLDKNMLLDHKCNYLLQHQIRPEDAVIVANKLLIDYIKKNYPNIPIIYSTTMNITNIDEINKITKSDIYVLNYNYNNNNQYLERLENKKNIEIICMEPCRPNCPNRIKHYTYLSKTILGIDVPEFNCPYKVPNTINKLLALPHAITNDRIDELSKMGFQYFKISGRTYNIPLWTYCILYYLVKPEYLDTVYVELLNSWW